MINANQITFGCEFETTLPATDTTPIGVYHHGLQVEWLPQGWRVERDGSIMPRTFGRKGAEFVSPKLTGEAGLAEVCHALDKLNERGARVNETCGLHITVTWNGDAAALARLISLVANHEKAIYASTGTSRRERGTYCRPVKTYNNAAAAERQAKADRYHLLNLTHLARGANRIEFRAFAGTLNKEKVVGYIRMVLGLVELALEGGRQADWSYEPKAGKNGPWHRNNAGPGEIELNRLYYRLGWTKGHAKKTYGMIENEVTVKATKKILTKMAEKYDSNN